MEKTLKFKMEDFEEFVKRMEDRLTKNHDKYGNDWVFTDMIDQMEEELLDLSNYSYLLYRKIRLYRQTLRQV